VKIDPIESTLKPPGTKRLKLKHYKLLSSFAFNSNLRRYIKAMMVKRNLDLTNEVGRCRLTL